MSSRLEALLQDLREDEDATTSTLGILARALLFRPRRRLMLLVRLQTSLYDRGSERLARVVSNRIYRRYHCFIAPSAKIGRGVLFAHPVGVVIGESAVVGDRCIIFQNVTLGKRSLGPGGYPVLGKDVVLFSGSQVLGEIALADGVTVGALSVVTHSCDVVGAKLVGTPARVVGQRTRERA
jgi:serine O-acetyltransferase